MRLIDQLDDQVAAFLKCLPAHLGAPTDAADVGGEQLPLGDNVNREQVRDDLQPGEDVPVVGVAHVGRVP